MINGNSSPRMHDSLRTNYSFMSTTFETSISRLTNQTKAAKVRHTKADSLSNCQNQQNKSHLLTGLADFSDLCSTYICMRNTSSEAERPLTLQSISSTFGNQNHHNPPQFTSPPQENVSLGLLHQH